MAAGRHAVAKSCFERALVFAPNYATLQINRGVVEGALGGREAAERHFRAAIRLNDDFDGNYFFARWLAQNGRAPEGVAYLRVAMSRGPGTSDARSLAMNLAAARGEAKELATIARESLAIDPRDAIAAGYAAGSAPFPVARDDYDAWFELGALKTSSGHDLEAAIAYRQALRVDPRSADALNNLGWSLARLGIRREARDAFSRALAIRPDFELGPGHRTMRSNQVDERPRISRPFVLLRENGPPITE
jgi:tetratricopeptide (TPR) repeat protein